MQTSEKSPLVLEIEIAKIEGDLRQVQERLNFVTPWAFWSNLKASQVAKSNLLAKNTTPVQLFHLKSLDVLNTEARVELASVIASQKKLTSDVEKLNSILDSLKKEVASYGQIRKISDYRH